MSELQSSGQLDDLRDQIDRWLDRFEAESDAVLAVDRDTADGSSIGEPRWYVRLAGETRETTTVWMTLGQRTLRFETHVVPVAEHADPALWRHLLRRNHQLVGVAFGVGDDGAIYLRGQIPDVAISPGELDRMLGTLYDTVEADFESIVRLAFG